METSNPVLSRRNLFNRGGTGGYTAYQPVPAGAAPYGIDTTLAAPRAMTIEDVVVRTAGLLGVVLLTGTAAWIVEPAAGIVIGAAILGFVLAMVATFKRAPSVPVIIAYAACQGVFLGAVSQMFNAQWRGIVLEAIMATALAFGGMLWAYSTRRIRVTAKFQKMVMGALFAVFGMIIVNLLVSLFVAGGLGIRGNGPLAVLFSLVAIGVAVFILALDFDAVEKGVAARAPEREAWRAAFGLVVTLVWLYLEILRLIAILRGD